MGCATGTGDLNAEITSRTQAGVTRDSESPASVDLAATIHLIEKAPDAERYTDHLFLTGRSVCSCEQEPPLGTVISSKGRLVYEKKLVERFSEGGRVRPELSIRDANRLSASIHQEMVQSINSPDRYPRNTVDLLDTQLIADVLGTALRRTDKKLNPRVADWSGDAADLARRVSRYAPRTTRAALLEIPLPEQVERFGLTFDEAISLRRALVDLPAPEGPRPLPVPTPIKVPRLTGRHLDAARATLTDLDLDVGAITEQDNSLAAGMVVAQDPEAGDAVEPGTQVALSISSGLSVVLPDVVGHGLAEAMCRLLDSGVQGHPSVEGPTGRTHGSPNSYLRREHRSLHTHRSHYVCGRCENAQSSEIRRVSVVCGSRGHRRSQCEACPGTGPSPTSTPEYVGPVFDVAPPSGTPSPVLKHAPSTSRPSTALHSYAAVSSFIRSFRRTDSVKHINRRGGGAASGSDSNAINAGIACTADAGLLGGAGPIISTWQGQMSQASF
ncbi:PASTA domain-containing protein [Rhodococcus koreensis]|uniref:PASTA domain-containing protein n=1 Tax=Rhodococcus koreensis TaxID=99653 RepID=A0A1H4I894_9NOCA|nr:PASTA domain-containing protein [Rhodococcus koreensis]SEB30130.1 PASTA domain-containing protein [Rhodococcus koreensis]